MLPEDLSEFGAHFIVGLSGPTLSDLDRRILTSLRPAGVLLLKRNFAADLTYERWLEKYRALYEEILRCIERPNIFVSIDHEGGPVQTAPAPLTNFGPALSHRNRASEVARAMALELRSLGVNLSWAPVVDINSNPKNPIIGMLGRAYGDSAEEVSRYALPLMRGLLENGILPCAKHYPGHGDTWSDSHLELPSVDADSDLLHRRELAPYRRLIDAGVPLIMTAHVIYPKIDPRQPATVSRRLINDILREEFAFDGVVVADNIDMAAIVDRFRTAQGVADAVNAGIDLFIVSRLPDPTNDEGPLQAARFLREAIQCQLVSQASLESAARRVNALLARTPMPAIHQLDAALLARHEKLRTSSKGS